MNDIYSRDADTRHAAINAISSGMAAEPAVQASPMQIAMETMRDELDRIYATVDDLAHFISPIIGPAPSDDSTEMAVAPPGKNSEMVTAVLDDARRVRNLRLQLQTLIARVEF